MIIVIDNNDREHLQPNLEVEENLGKATTPNHTLSYHHDLILILEDH